MKGLTQEKKAMLWDALMSCQRIRLFGYAALGDVEKQFIGLELWSRYPEEGRECQSGCNDFLKFIKAMLPQEKQAKLPTGDDWYQKLLEMEGDSDVSTGGGDLKALHGNIPAKILMDQSSACFSELPKTNSVLCSMLWKAFDRGRAYEATDVKRAMELLGEVPTLELLQICTDDSGKGV